VRVDDLGPEWDTAAASLLAVPLAMSVERSLDRVALWRRMGRPPVGIVADGELIGAAQLRAPDDANFEVVLVAVEAARRGQGLGSTLWRHVRASVDARKDQVMTVVRDDDAASLVVVRRWGFTPFQHEIPAVLELRTAASPMPVAGVTFEIRRGFGDVMRDGELAKAYAASDTSPEAESGQVVEWPALLRLAGDVDGVVVVARAAGGEVAGLAVASAEVDGTWLVMYTGVVPAHRGRGIARALKEHLHDEVARRGAPSVRTLNEVGNLAIRGLNARLGYVARPGAIRLRQPVDPAWSRR
jgi:GNAT superfamily N-acetyltransferase